MATDVLPDSTTAFGKRVRRRLREEQVVWFTTVAADGTPQPNPVWFWWDGTDVVVYSRPDARRLANLRRRPQVSLHFDGNGRGGNIVVLKGTAAIDEQTPPAHRLRGYASKYRAGMVRVSGGMVAFGEDYSVPIRIRVTGVRGL